MKNKKIKEAFDILISCNFEIDKIQNDIEDLLKFGLKDYTIVSYAKKMESRWNIDKIKEAFTYHKSLINANKTIFYDVKYLILSYNITEEEALNKIALFKKNKATSKENFLIKHGEILGEELFKKFQKTSKSSTDKIKNDLIEKFPNTWKEEWVKYQKANSRRCIDFYISRNIAKTEEEAKKLVTQYQLNNSGVNFEYYKQKGYSEVEIEDLFDIINNKKGLTSRNRKHLKKIHGSKWLEIYEESNKKYRRTMESKGSWIKLEDLDEWIKYKLKVWHLTNQTIFFNNIKNIEKRSNEWHLDHIFSIKQGFVFNIEAEIIASPINLKIVSRHYNCSKNSKCDIELDQLYENYKKWRQNEN